MPGRGCLRVCDSPLQQGGGATGEEQKTQLARLFAQFGVVGDVEEDDGTPGADDNAEAPVADADDEADVSNFGTPAESAGLREDLAALEKDYEEVSASSSFAGAGESGFGSDGEF